MTKPTLLTGLTLAVAQALLLSLGACGGGGGYSSGGGGMATATYTVGGSVSGLTGSGLVLGNGADSLPVSADGPFTFATKVAAGAGYNVSVATQPTNPSQTCSVGSGSGTMGSSNVTNVAVACTATLANEKLTGAYQVVDFVGDSPFNYEGDFSDLLTLTFDGAGNFTGTAVENGDGRIYSSPVSGTYAVTVDGTLTIGLSVGLLGTSPVTGSLSADGNTLVAGQTTASGSQPMLLFAIKQGQSTFSNASLTGAYSAVHYDSHSAGDSGGLLAVTFDGSGNFSGTDTLNNAGTVSTVSVAGTYAVAADGTLMISPAGAAPITGALSADGTTLLGSQLTSGTFPSVVIGIKRGQTGFSNADLNGTYRAATFAYNSMGNGGGLYPLTFNGAGSITGVGVFNSAGTITSSDKWEGPYTVAADGTLTLSPFEFSPVIGSLSADGNTLLAAQLTAGQVPEVLVGIK